MKSLQIEENELSALKWVLIKGMEITNSDQKYEVFDKLLKSLEESTLTICDACKVREPWEHRCFGVGCDCDRLMCLAQQKRITNDQLMSVVNGETTEENLKAEIGLTPL